MGLQVTYRSRESNEASAIIVVVCMASIGLMLLVDWIAGLIQ